MKFSQDKDYIQKRIDAYKTKKDNPDAGNRDFIFTGKVPYFAGHDGDNTVRILPATWEEAYFPWYEVYTHYWEANKGSYLCLSRMYNRPCPFCEEAAKQSGDETRTLFPSHRGLAWIIDRADPTKGPLMFNMPYKKLPYQIINISINKKTGVPIFVDDIEVGRDISFKRSGKGLKTQYDAVQKEDEASALDNDKMVQQQWLDFVDERPIPTLLKVQTYEYLKSVLHGTVEVAETNAPITSAASKKKEEHHVNGIDIANVPVGDGLSIAVLEKMDRDGLVGVVEKRNLGIDPSEWQDTDDLRQAVQLELGLVS